MTKFKYEIIMCSEKELITKAGQLYYPSTPNVKRKPHGWLPRHGSWKYNRGLAKLDQQTRNNDKLDAVLKKLDKYRLKYTKRYEKIQYEEEQWSALGKWVKVPVGDTVTYCIIESIKDNKDAYTVVNSSNNIES